MTEGVARRLILATLVALLSACGAQGPSSEPSSGPTGSIPATAPATQSAGPLNTAGPSAGPTAAPTEIAEASPSANPDPCSNRVFDGPWTIDPLVPGSAVRVTVAELNLRAGPCTGADSIAILKRGDILITEGGPTGPAKGNGFPWYEVLKARVGSDGNLVPLPERPFTYGADTLGGWIAANDGTRPYVTAVEPRCPSTVDLEHVVGMLDAERLACFNGPIVLKGTFGCGGCGGTGGPISKPNWLADTFEFDHLWVKWFDDNNYVSLHFKPSGPEKPREGSIIRVTVHVDDPASTKCSHEWAIETPSYVVPQEFSVLYCRERFVVDSYEVLGRDPDY